ncbi:hypothetical protein ONZ45_g1092 [Pleurotus djamor]|nr:hypothetical protein ONZ45_g1092 [Pleurotus djamor]
MSLRVVADLVETASFESEETVVSDFQSSSLKIEEGRRWGKNEAFDAYPEYTKSYDESAEDVSKQRREVEMERSDSLQWVTAALCRLGTGQQKQEDTQDEIWTYGERFPIPPLFLDYPPIVYYFSESDIDLCLRYYDGPFQGAGGIKEKRQRLSDCIAFASETMTPKRLGQLKAFYYESQDEDRKVKANCIHRFFRYIGLRRQRQHKSKDRPLTIPTINLDHPGMMRHWDESRLDFYLSKLGIPYDGRGGGINKHAKCKLVMDAFIALKLANPDEVVMQRPVGKRPLPMPQVFYDDPNVVNFYDDFDIDLYLDLYVAPEHQGTRPQDLEAKRKILRDAILSAKAREVPSSEAVTIERYWQNGESITVKGLCWVR